MLGLVMGITGFAARHRNSEAGCVILLFLTRLGECYDASRSSVLRALRSPTSRDGSRVA